MRQANYFLWFNMWLHINYIFLSRKLIINENIKQLLESQDY